MSLTKIINRNYTFKDGRIILKSSPANNQIMINATSLFTIAYDKTDLDYSHRDSIPNDFQLWCTLFKFAEEKAEHDTELTEIGKKIEPLVIDHYCSITNNQNYKTQVETKRDFLCGRIDLMNEDEILEIKSKCIDRINWYKSNGNLLINRDLQNKPIIKFNTDSLREVLGKKFGVSFLRKQKNTIRINKFTLLPKYCRYTYQLLAYLYTEKKANGTILMCLYHYDEIPNQSSQLTFFNADEYAEDNPPSLPLFYPIKLTWSDKEDEIITRAKKWYHDHIESLVSPKMFKTDLIWFEEQIFNINKNTNHVQLKPHPADLETFFREY